MDKADLDLLQSIVDLIACQQTTLMNIVTQNKLLIERIRLLEIRDGNPQNFTPAWTAQEIVSDKCGGAEQES